MNQYLKSSETIDWKNPDVLKKALELSQGKVDPVEIAKFCFEYVRDEIKHSSDYKLNPVTCKASDVLRHKTGFCYAKAHLLTALLRANKIPTGLCYQRLTIEGNVAPYCLHGLNAVYLPEFGWYRMDARGNKEGIFAKFDPPIETLAFTILAKGEADLPEIWSEPLPEIIQILNSSTYFQEVLDDLPDIELMNR